MTSGLVAVLVGLLCACAGVAWAVRSNRRQGLAHPMREAFRIGVNRSPLGVERAAAAQGARLAFPAYTLFVVGVTLATGHSQMAGLFGGAAGFIYGFAAAVSGSRFAR